jgi:hypothetical protein
MADELRALFWLIIAVGCVLVVRLYVTDPGIVDTSSRP